MHRAQNASTPRNLCEMVNLSEDRTGEGLNLHLDQDRLELTEPRILTSIRARFRYQTCDIHPQVAPGREEDQTIDRLVEAGRGEESDEDEAYADDGYD